MGTETVLIVGGSALLLIVVSVILAAILAKTGRKRKEDDAAYEAYTAERKAALREAEAEQRARKEAEAAEGDRALLAAPVAETKAAEEEACPAEAEEDEEKDEDEEDLIEEDHEEDEDDILLDEDDDEDDEDDIDLDEVIGEPEASAEPVKTDEPEEAEEAEEPEEPEEVEEPEEPEEPGEPEEAEEAVHENVLIRVIPDIGVRSANMDPSAVHSGEPVSFIAIGKNLFVRQDKRIIGSVRRREDAEMLMNWIRTGSRAEATLCAGENDALTLNAALYGDPMQTAVREGLEPVKLRGTKSEQVQGILRGLRPGTLCTAERAPVDSEKPGWLVSCDDGCIGLLDEDAYEEGRCLVLAEVRPAKKDETRLKPYVYIL